jgi:hypothetical protein
MEGSALFDSGAVTASVTAILGVMHGPPGHPGKGVESAPCFVPGYSFVRRSVKRCAA